MYASGITYTGVASVSPAAGTLTGANNGLTVSTIDPTKAVLGQNTGQPGAPGKLISNREIPLNGLRLTIGTDATGTIFHRPHSSAWVDALGNDTVDIIPSNNITTVGLVGQFLSAVGAAQQIVYNNPAGTGFLNDFTSGSSIEIDAGTIVFCAFHDNTAWASGGGSGDYISFDASPTSVSSAPASGNLRGFFFKPLIVTIGTGKIIAFENQLGDVYLNSTAGARIGRTGIHAITTPTAWLHLGAGAAAASSSPLKLTAGVNQTVAEAGAVEYDGTNYFVTNGTATRYTVAKTLTATAVLAFAATTGQTEEDLTIVLPGAADGDVVVLGVPIAALNPASCYTAFVSSINTVTVRLNDYSLLGVAGGTGTFRVSILKY